MADTLRFWSGWPDSGKPAEVPGGNCEADPKLLFNGASLAFSTDPTPPTQENCCCCDQSEYCIEPKKPSMVTVSFSGVVAGTNCTTTECNRVNSTVFELQCSRTGTGAIGGGLHCYEVGFSALCSTYGTYDALLYCVFTNLGGTPANWTPFVKLHRSSGGERNVNFYNYALDSTDYDLDCTETRTDLTDINDSESGAWCDFSSASVTVDPIDCSDY